MGATAPTSQLEALHKLGLSDAEIAEVLATDKEIDRGAKLFELDPELKAGAKKARRADRTDTPKPRERKVDNEKRELITCFTESLADLRCCEGFDITELQIANPEHEFSFIMNGKKYKVILSAPRK